MSAETEIESEGEPVETAEPDESTESEPDEVAPTLKTSPPTSRAPSPEAIVAVLRGGAEACDQLSGTLRKFALAIEKEMRRDARRASR